MAGWGKITGGIVLLIIGIILSAIGFSINNECNSIGGQLGSLLSSQQQQKCSFGSIGLIIGIFLSIIGLILIIVGSVTGGKKKEGPTQEALNISSLQQPDTNNKIYCRYCGKQRPATGHYCPSCGRSTSTSVDERNSMKQCMYCRSLLSDDSLFCSNCGRKFSQESSFTSTSTPIIDKVSKAPLSNMPYSGEKIEVLKAYENSNYAFKVKYPTTWAYENISDKQKDGIIEVVRFFSESASDDYVLIWIDPRFRIKKEGLNQYLSKIIDAYRHMYQNSTIYQDFVLINSSVNISLQNNSGYSLEWSYLNKEDDRVVQCKQQGILPNDMVYHIQYCARKDTFYVGLPMVQKITDSFEIISSISG